VIEKLKIALMIPTNEVSNDRLARFFQEKFQDADIPDFQHNMPDDRKKELLNRSVFGVEGGHLYKS
jgi:hypothetical protein